MVHMMSGTPAAEIEITPALVRALLRDQHPELADLSLTFMDAGWDNAMFRLGDHFTVRLPRRKESASLLINEQDWLPKLSSRLPIPVSAPLHIGLPGHSYPWRWSILPWLDGQPANEFPPIPGEAAVFASFLQALHRPAPEDAPVNAVRGCPLAHRVDVTRARLLHLRDAIEAIVPEVEKAWSNALAAPVAEAAYWLHGDLHARNVLVNDGAISAVIDWGDITSGDVATDLAGIWALFESAKARQSALQAYGATEAETARAMGWAIQFGTVLLATGLVDNPRHAAMGRDTLRRVAEDQLARRTP